jgi:hypothetical protein
MTSYRAYISSRNIDKTTGYKNTTILVMKINDDDDDNNYIMTKKMIITE